MNYSFSHHVKCVAGLQYCYLLLLFHDGQYSKLIRPNTWLLCYWFVRYVIVAHHQLYECQHVHVLVKIVVGVILLKICNKIRRQKQPRIRTN